MQKWLLYLIVGTIFLLIIRILSDIESVLKFKPHLSYFQESSIHRDVLTIHGIDDADSNNLANGKNIFFHETSTFGKDGAILNARQACAVESAAKISPGMAVYVLFSGAVKFSNASEEIVRRLTSYDNIKIRHILVEQYMKGTPLEEWWATDVLKNSLYPKIHLADILRFLTLWKYSGIYLDLEVVIMSNLEGLTNFAGAQEGSKVAVGAMGFGGTGIGRKVADACLNELKTKFRSDLWDNNGSGVITRSLQKICATQHVSEMTETRCQGFMVYPPSAFYPIHYSHWRRYFETDNVNAHLKMVEKSLAIHVWNKLSHEKEVNVGSQVLYGLIAEKYCPKVYSHCGKIF